MHLPSRLAVVCVVVVAIAAMLGTAQAQVGARAMGMGGAFVGLADDAQATYYNPAGLAFQSCANATYSVETNSDENLGARHFVAYTSPFDEQTAIGLSYMKRTLASISMYEPEGTSSLEWSEDQYWFSVAYRYDDKLSLGANFRWTTDDLEVVFEGVSISASADTQMAVDLGLLYCMSSRASLGLMIRDLTEPEQSVVIEGETFPSTLARTFSVGAAFRNPAGVAPGMTAVIQVEDISDAIDRSFRFGVEQRTPAGCYNYVWRAGWFGDTNSVTLGAGVAAQNWGADVAVVDPGGDTRWLVSVSAVF